MARELSAPVEESRMYGWGRVKPRWAQTINNLRWYTVFIVIFLLAWSMSGASMGAAIPHIEKQFGLTSKKSALLSTSSDIGSSCVQLMVNYLSTKYNMAKLFSAGAFFCGIGGILMSVPHYIAGAPNFASLGVAKGNNTVPDICPHALPRINSTLSPPPDSNTGDYSAAYGVMVFGEVLRGFGTATVYSAGLTYIDVNGVYPKSAFYIGIAYTASPVALTIGSLLFGYVVDHVYLDFDTAPQDEIPSGPEDPRWIGAWWLGFLGGGAISLLVCMPLSGFPKYLPGIKKPPKMKIGDASGDSVAKTVINVVRDFLNICKRLLLNAEYMAITAAIAITTVGGFGIAVFSMKYLTQMYDLSFQEASYITAGKNFIAGIGFFVAGLVIRKAKLEALGIEKLGVILLFLSGTLGLGNLARCNNVPLAGIEVPYPGESVPAGINSTCQGLCECEGFLYQPVCGPDDVVYYSPCHAGCTDNTVINNTVTYTNCSCVPGDHTVTAGECQKGCYGLYISSVCLFLSSFLFSMALSNSSIAILRCVDDDLKAFGLGTLALLSGIVGFVPSPVIIGAIVDSTCLHWSSGGSESGFCQVYDREKLSYAYSFIQLIANVIGSVLFFLAVKANITRRRKTEENNEPVQSGNTEPVQTKTNENSAQQ